MSHWSTSVCVFCQYRYDQKVQAENAGQCASHLEGDIVYFAFSDGKRKCETYTVEMCTSGPLTDETQDWIIYGDCSEVHSAVPTFPTTTTTTVTTTTLTTTSTKAGSTVSETYPPDRTHRSTTTTTGTQGTGTTSSASSTTTTTTTVTTTSRVGGHTRPIVTATTTTTEDTDTGMCIWSSAFQSINGVVAKFLSSPNKHQSQNIPVSVSSCTCTSVLIWKNYLCC